MSLYLISDTHFDHKNIIKYCNRPFNSLSEMDSQLRQNWNEIVSEEDIVLFGGDLAMARSSVALDYADELSGTLIFIKGNHDDINENNAPFPLYNHIEFSYEYDNKTYQFYYVHWPKVLNEDEENPHMDDYPSYSEPPKNFEGWVLHGTLITMI